MNNMNTIPTIFRCERVNIIISMFVIFRGYSVFLESCGNLLVLCVALLTVISRDSISPGLAGLAITYSLQVS